MALFATRRDAELMLHFNREIVNRIVDASVAIYQIDTSLTKTNIYNESNGKVYYSPILIKALVRQNPTTLNAKEEGLIYQKDLRIGFIREDLEQLGLILKPGDILNWDNRMFEIGMVYSSAYWANRNPDTEILTDESLRGSFGYNISVMVDAFAAKETTLQISSVRQGNQPKMNDSQNDSTIYN